MAITINTNISSLNAQSNLNKAQGALEKSLERLSSGSRINSARDDAAGLAISQRLTAQVNGNNVAIRNSNDAISLTATAEGALQETTNILLRLRDLSVQAASDTNTASDRTALQEEAAQLFSEIDRIASSTQFNTRNLIDGSFGTASIQVGANSGQTIEVTLGSATTKDMNLNGFSELGDLNGGRVTNTQGNDLNGSSFVLNGVTVTFDNTQDDFAIGGNNDGVVQSAADIAAGINRFTGQTGVRADAYNVVTGGAGASGLIDASTFSIAVGTDGADVSNAAAGSGFLGAQQLSRSATSLEDLAGLINDEIAGVNASINSDGQLVLANDDGRDITITGGSAAGLEDTTYRGYVSMESSDGTDIEISYDTSLDTANQAAQQATIQDMGFNLSTGPSSAVGTAVDSNTINDTDLITINGVRIGASTDGTASAKAAAINSVSDQTGVTASASTELVISTVDFTGNAPAANGVTINGTEVDLSAATDISDVVTAINSTNIQGVIAEADSVTGNLILRSSSGFDIDVEGADAAAFFGTDVDVGNVDSRGTITLTNTEGGDVLIGSDAATQSARQAALDKIGLVGIGGSEEAISSGLNLTTRQGANIAIDRIDEALEFIASQRSEIGAVQNRLTSAVNNLSIAVVNQTAARSQILDTDFASETANLTKSQILQQASSSILAQANQTPQVALSLLQGG